MLETSKRVSKKAQKIKDDMPDWMKASHVNVMHVECDENGVHTIYMVKAHGVQPHVIGKYIETENGIEELHLLSEELEKNLKLCLTDVQIGGCALLAARYFKDNPDGHEAVMSIVATKESPYKGANIEIVVPRNTTTN